MEELEWRDSEVLPGRCPARPVARLARRGRSARCAGSRRRRRPELKSAGEPAWVAAATALAAALRFATLGDQSLWLDEAITVELLRMGFGGMLGAIPDSESTPPLYYLLAWPWVRVFGTGEVGLRAFSALCGTATVPVAYAAGATLASRRAGAMAAFLVAASPLLVWYSQEARAYALFVLCGALSFLFFVRALREPSTGALGGWAAASAAALASHYFAVFLVAVEAALLLTLARPRRPVALASGAVAAVGLALLPLALYQERGGRTNWIDDTPLTERARDALREFLAGMYPLPHGATLAALVLAGTVAFVVFAARSSERRNAFLALGVGAATFVLPLALALAGFDYFLTRNLIVAWLPIAIFLAVALASDRARWAGVAIAGVFVASSTGVVATTASRDDLARDDWRSVAARLETPGQKLVVVAPEYERAPLEYYRPDVRAIGTGMVLAREILLLGYPLEDEGFPPSWFRVPASFRRVESRLYDRIRLLRFRAPGPIRLRAADVGGASVSSAVLFVDRGGL